jgi:4a-hydroxytetrahydrobiopterin dehydratase
MQTKNALPNEELHALVKELPGWTLDGGKLVREWTFADFVAAMAFVNQVGELAEAANHHPDIDIRYNKVVLSLVSHDAGGITARDASMARQLSERFPG